MTTPTLGSLNEFAAAAGKPPKEAFGEYTAKLVENRQQIAKQLGVNVMELHEKFTAASNQEGAEQQ